MTHGGKRQGAGRKPRSRLSSRHTVIVYDDTFQALKTLGGGFLSRGVDKAAQMLTSGEQLTLEVVAHNELTPEVVALLQYAVDNHRKFTTDDRGGGKNAWMEKVKTVLSELK